MGPMEFIAQLINNQESAKEGYSCATRWLCLREDLKAKYLKMAEDGVNQFISDEKQAEKRREEY